MIIQLINMNIWLRKYPVEVWWRCHLNFRYHPLWVTSIVVAVHSRCRQGIAVQTRCRWSSRSLVVDVVVRTLVVDVEEVVVRKRAVAWRRSPKTLSPAYPEQDLNSKARFRRLCSRRYRARGASDGDAKEQQTEGEERSPKQEYLLFVDWRLEGERRASYIGEQQAQGVNLDVTVNALQVVTVVVKALSYCRGLRATGNSHD
jgi:hypothetical protein